ncbi:Basic amino-acid permease [Emydomyces testavorans]|uniref:Basic amino-acid permease n=1 Tax=Emydomyces testavorans TaxID=2070801 RepID=A0AAF0DF30_9EURO|nr:Basic amino-acid permease [Emydomyces testavorans]
MASQDDTIKPQYPLDEKPHDIEKSTSTDLHPLEDEHPAVVADKLSRKLSARQVQMIAIAGTIGTGLFLGTGKSLATGGPASMLISYAIVGAIVFVTMLSLGEMAAFMPIAGSFCTFAGRFVDDSLGFGLTWVYWFNDAISTAADLVALQLLLAYWSNHFPAWAFSLLFWIVLIALNIITVKAYGEVWTYPPFYSSQVNQHRMAEYVEYWLSILKVTTIIVSCLARLSPYHEANPLQQIFIILGVVVNCGGNTDKEYIGGRYWHIGDAPFVGGIGGFASVFVTASFQHQKHLSLRYQNGLLTKLPSGGTESIAITAGETRNPTRNLPRVIRNVFWRILIFYILAILIIGLNVPYNYPGLSTKNSNTSPFTIVFQRVGSKVAGSFINAVIMTSVISAGNHALFAGARLMYTLAVDRHAPAFLGRLTRRKVPWVAVLVTSVVSGICFGASYIGAGQLWTWLQKTTQKLTTPHPTPSIVGVSNQLSWLFIGVASLRFRRALHAQNLTHLLPFKNWTYPLGPILSITLNTLLILVQGWSSFSPRFKPVDFVSFYVQIPVLGALYVAWKVARRTKWVALAEMDLVTDRWDGGRFGPGSGEGATRAARRGDDWRDERTWEGTGGEKRFWELPVKAKVVRAGQWLFF